jgi:hypothetical protein
MKTYIIITFCILFNLLSYGQKKESYIVDNSKPENVVNAIFYAAENNDFSVLEGLCDPENMGDDDTKMICWLCDTSIIKDSTAYDFISESGSKYDSIPLDTVKREMKEFLSDWSPQFVRMFEKGKIVGNTKYMTGIEGIPDIPSAYVSIQYNDPKGNMIKDSVLLIKRKGKWYLIGI